MSISTTPRQVLFVQGGGGEGTHDEWDNKLVDGSEDDTVPFEHVRLYASVIPQAVVRRLSGRYLALLWGDLMVSILLRTREAPGTTEIDHRVSKATEDFLRLYA